MDVQEVKAQAEHEYAEEQFREAVERHKQWLRTRQTLWDRIFPWKIVIIKKGVSGV